MNYDIQKNKHSPAVYIPRMDFFLQLDIILSIVYKSIVNFCPYYQLIKFWDRIRCNYMDSCLGGRTITETGEGILVTPWEGDGGDGYSYQESSTI